MVGIFGIIQEFSLSWLPNRLSWVPLLWHFLQTWNIKHFFLNPQQSCASLGMYGDYEGMLGDPTVGQLRSHFVSAKLELIILAPERGPLLLTPNQAADFAYLLLVENKGTKSLYVYIYIHSRYTTFPYCHYSLLNPYNPVIIVCIFFSIIHILPL